MTPFDTFLLARDVQIVLLVIFVAAGITLLLRGEHRWRPLGATAIWFVLVAGALWVFVPIPGDQPALLIHRSWRWIEPQTATFLMLWGDLLIVLSLVWLTGGSERSCFSPLYFMLPTFTLLLLNYGNFVVFYSIVAMGFFGLTLFGRNAEVFFRPHKSDYDLPSLARASRIALWVISALCLFLAIYIDGERHKSVAQVPSQEHPQDEKADPPRSPGPGASASPSPRTVPTPNNTPTTAPPVATPVSIPTPVPGAPKAPAMPMSRLTSYSDFLRELKGLHLKKESVQRRILSGYIGEHISWEVKFQGYRFSKREITIFFSEVNSGQPAKHRAVKFGKASQKYRRIIQHLPLGASLHIEGSLRRHSATELFVNIAVLTPSN